MSAEDLAAPSSHDELYQRVVEVLRALPPATAIAWGDDTVADEPVLTHSLDIWAPEVARPTRMNWVWTIESPERAALLEDEVDDVAGPLDLEVAFDGVDDAGKPGWLPESLSRVLEDWVTIHTGRDDLVFVYDPDLTSDWVKDMLARREARGDFDPPLVEDPDGLRHRVADGPERHRTACGREIGSGWPWVSAEISPGDDPTEAFVDALARLCWPCHG